MQHGVEKEDWASHAIKEAYAQGCTTEELR